ncbi:MAG: MATE family efflux transporter [Acidaminococcus sp.]|uniref:MATE family efflux transporter n=1 Tax=Acidaminococcus sp. TaxID=1872103 RepID=UPI002A752C14|nr:MATE family efflux transporter [Acidaminococcus sp.]MDY2739314.1 MATE family efflux transporter [Acidaminococcus sp.]
MIANPCGVTDAAPVGIVEKIISCLLLVPFSLLSADSALRAQNLGADNRKRATAYLYDAVKTAALFGLSVFFLRQVMALHFVGLFASDEAVIASGGPYLKGYIFDTIFEGIHFSFSSYFCAAKKHLFFFSQSHCHRLCEDSFRLFGILGFSRWVL